MHSSSINLMKKKFNTYPAKVIWIQLAGLDDEQIAQLSLKEGETKKNSFEAFSCFGTHWEFNLTELYPSSEKIMHSMLTGNPNVVGNCNDFTAAPFWSYYTEKNAARTVVIEKQALIDQSLLKVKQCPNANPSWNSDYLIKLDNIGSELYPNSKFNVLQKNRFKEKGIYFDSSCNQEKCNTSLLTSVSYLVDEIVRYEKRYTLVIKDFSAENFFKNKKFADWEKWLNEWNQVISYLQNSLMTDDTLLLVSGVAPIPIQFPAMGVDMKKWIKQYSGLQVKPRSLFGKTWAMGARAENFCGLYRTEDLVSRLFWYEKEKSFLGL